MPTERQQRPRDTIPRNAIGALLAVTFAYPIILCAAFFPTPSGELREHINLGLTFPLHTWPNPPGLQPSIKDSPAQTLSLPYRRTLRKDRQIYVYYLVAPRGC